MLSIYEASQKTAFRRRSDHPSVGLAIAGGGPVGAVYELGALRALEESIDGLRLHHLDVYVGVSAGALWTAQLAQRRSDVLASVISMSRSAFNMHCPHWNFLKACLIGKINSKC